MMIPVVHATELNLVYDQNGNLLYGDGKYREYNSLNQLVRIRSSDNSTILEEYVHDPVAERILMKRIYNSSNQVGETVYYVDENFVRVVNTSGTYDSTYVMHEGQKIAELKADGSKLFMHDDLEGSVGAITNGSGSVVENTLYSPHGEILSGGTLSRFDSEGKEFSSVTGDTDFHFRKMNPSWGLFLQPDTLIPNVYDPQSLNRYMFERGNPYKNVDKDGHFIEANDDNVDNFPQRVIALGITNYLKDQVKKEANLQKELTQKYSDTSGKTCFGCTADGPPSFEYLQKEELRNEFDLLLDKDKKIMGFTYKGETVKANNPGAIAKNLADKGFEKYVVKQEVKQIYKEKTGETYSNRWWSIFKSITLKQQKAKENKKSSKT